MDDLNTYVILAGVCLIFGTIIWAGFISLWPRLRRTKRRGKKRQANHHF
jgi:hypothetical protein